jgi:hypothetical protein
LTYRVDKLVGLTQIHARTIANVALSFAAAPNGTRLAKSRAGDDAFEIGPFINFV